MRAFIWIFFLFSMLNAVDESVVDRYAGIEYYELDNGLEVYLLSDEMSENTQIRVKVKVGSSLEDDETFGLSHLVEHIVFRDQRVPHRDYLDYITEEGGTYVNGYTKPYETEYTATIDSNRSYWIAETFAQMLLDKNVTNVDLEMEKGALQTEIGEYKWSSRFLIDSLNAVKSIFPEPEDLYRDSFALEKKKDLPQRYWAQQNNRRFTLVDVLQHYDTYYYPANMRLMIVGNFDVETMKAVIEKAYGHSTKQGTQQVVKPLANPSLNQKPYYHFFEGMGKNSGYIGIKYLLDDYKKHLILSAYMNNVALRIQQHLRNKQGNSYSVSPYLFNARKAGVAAVYFDGLRDDFENNIAYVKKVLSEDVLSLEDSTIDEALRKYEIDKYASKEHDSKSLMSLVNVAEYLRVEQNISDKTPYEIFHSITHDEFRDVLKSTFVPENSYELIYRDYYLFPLEMQVFSMLMMVLLAFVYFRIHRIDYYAKGLRYTKRDVVLERRLSNRFLGFLEFVVVYLLASFVWEWLKYLLSALLFDDAYYLYTINVPYSYVVTVIDELLLIVLFVLIYRYLFNYYAHVDVDKENIYLVGNKITVIAKDTIEAISVVKWSPDKYLKIKGLVLFFWKPLVEVRLKNGKIFYLRAGNATHLEEDLRKNLDT